MNKYRVVWQKETKKDLAKIAPAMVKKITERVEEYLVKDPYHNGEPLFYEWKGYYCLRFSDYRIIYKIKEEALVILVVKIGHRREVY